MTTGAGIITFFLLIQAYLLLKTATQLTNLTNGPFLSKEYWKKEIVFRYNFLKFLLSYLYVLKLIFFGVFFRCCHSYVMLVIKY